MIVGGGMGGVQAAKTLAKAPVEITLLSARNYYLFQPLIYEVANALLQPEDIAHSIRGLLRKHTNVHFRLGAATGVDWDQSELLVDSGEPIGFGIAGSRRCDGIGGGPRWIWGLPPMSRPACRCDSGPEPDTRGVG